MTRTVVVGPNPGDDYTSLTAAEAGEVGALTQPLVIQLRAGVYPESVAFSAEWTTTATNTITLCAFPGDEHGGVIGAGPVIQSADRVLFVDSSVHFNIQDIEIVFDGSSNTANIIRGPSTHDRVIYRVSSGSQASPALDLSDVGIIRNCLFEVFDYRAIDLSGVACFVENCTIVCTNSSNRLGVIGAFNATIKNTAIIGFTRESVFGSVLSNVTNASDDGAIHSVTLASTDFTDYANGDYTPAPGGALDGAGTDLSVDFTDDITGATRTAPWDIGAFAVAASAVTIPTLSLASATSITANSIVPNVTLAF